MGPPGLPGPPVSISCIITHEKTFNTNITIGNRVIVLRYRVYVVRRYTMYYLNVMCRDDVSLLRLFAVHDVTQSSTVVILVRLLTRRSAC